MIGSLVTVAALDRPDLLAGPVLDALRSRTPSDVDDVLVAEIDPALADTAAFCERYSVGLDVSANCVIVAGRRGDATRMAAAVVLATTRADVNSTIRRRLDARRASFAPMDDAVSATGMEYGGITPIGLPSGWPILVDPAVVEAPWVIVGSGVRRSKLVLPGVFLASLQHAEVVEGLGLATT